MPRPIERLIRFAADHPLFAALALVAAGALAAGLAASRPPVEGPTITARSVGYETPCAEMDNVLVSLSGEAVSGFEIHATHPVYLAGMEGDSMAADFTGCVFPEEPIWTYEPFTTTLYEDDRIVLRGHRLRHSWRPEIVDFSVGDRRVSGLHLTQLILKRPEGDVEILVLYPADGYWRPKPPPPADRADTGFGASFLIGPVEKDRRELVRLTEVGFDPETLTYRLRFARGGWATLRVVSAAPEGLRLDVRFGPGPRDGVMTLLSSMHVAPDNADVSRVRVREPGSARWKTLSIDALIEAEGAEFAFGRDVPSRHNYSAPDVAFGPFR
jgi:hypothetical protein